MGSGRGGPRGAGDDEAEVLGRMKGRVRKKWTGMKCGRSGGNVRRGS